MDISLLPDDVLIRVLSCASPPSVAKLRCLNSRINGIVSRHRLGRPVVNEFSAQLRATVERTAPIGRIQLRQSNKMKKRLVVTMRRQNKQRQTVEESCDGPSTADTTVVAEAMRKVKVAERLSFDGVTVDSSFHQMLTSKWNDLSAVNDLTFTLSRLSLSEEQLITLLERTAVHSLTLDFCHFESDLITDKVFSTIPHIRCLRVQPRSTLYLQSFTDATLLAWASAPPTTIGLYNCITGCTLQGILELVKACKLPQIDWDFGRVMSSANSSEALLTLTMTPGVSVKITDDYRSRRIQIEKCSSKIAFNLLNEEIFTA